MYVRTAKKAIDLVANDLQLAASCVTGSVLRAEIVADDVTRAAIRFAASPRAKVGRRQERWISINVVVEAVQDDADTGSWRTHTRLYDFSLFDHPFEGDFLLGYHFHPSPRGHGYGGPHLHVGARPSWARGLKKTHLPTGRLHLEPFIRLLIEEMGIRRHRSDWRDIIARAEGRFADRRTW